MAEDDKVCARGGGLLQVVQRALAEFAELTGRTPVGATGVHRQEDGWSVLLDVVELERIPSTTSLMATYRLELDASGALCGYERVRRFVLGQVDPS